MMLSRIASLGTAERPFLRTISPRRFHEFSAVLRCSGVNSWDDGRERGRTGSMKGRTLPQAVTTNQQRISLPEEIPAKKKETVWEEQIEKVLH